MSLEVDFSILNQKGTPAFFADALANRPAAGFVGRIFVDTDSPSTGMYRDTGIAWINVTGGGAESQTLQNVCDIGNTCTTPVRFGTTNSLPSISSPFIVAMSTAWNANAPLQAASIQRSTAYFTSPIFNVGPAFSSVVSNMQESYYAPVSVPSGASAYGGIFSQNNFNFQAVGNDVTINQAGGLRAASAFRSQNVFASSGSGTISHLSGMFIGSVYMPSIFFGTATITNNYALLISNQTEQYVATMVNRWGVYQEGSADNNYFAGYVGVGSNVLVTGVKLNVEGGNLRVLGAGTTSATRGLQVLNSSGTTGLVVLDNGNVGVREAAPSARLHIATGGATTASIGLKVRNSADTIDILKTYGTTQVQVASTATALENTAQLQIDSVDRGFLLPRMTNAQIVAIVTPAEGLLIYNTTISHLCCYQSGAWVKFNHSPM